MADESVYPGALDGDLRALVPAGTTPAGFEDFLQLIADAVTAIQTELGIDPAGASADVATRFGTLDVVDQAAFVADAAALTAAAPAALTSTDVAAADATDTSTAVAAADAPAQTAAYVQADVEAIRTLANELKADFNLLRADFLTARTLANEEKADINALRADVTAIRTQVAAAVTDLGNLRTKINAVLTALRGAGKPMAAA